MPGEHEPEQRREPELVARVATQPGRHSASRMIVPNTSRRNTAPAGPIWANSVAAIAEPNCTEAIALTTSTPDGVRPSIPGGEASSLSRWRPRGPMLTGQAIVLDGATLDPGGVDAAARRGRRVELAPEARARNEAARKAIAALLERGEALYGATTGVGALRDRVIGESERERFQWNLLRSHAVSAGPPARPRAGPGRHGGPRQPARGRRGGSGAGAARRPGGRAQPRAWSPVTRELGSLGTGDLPGAVRDRAGAARRGQGMDRAGR